MRQFIADQIDQLDLALDQLAVTDRNFDRFAMMLVDNAVELALHQHARHIAQQQEFWAKLNKPQHDPGAITAALGRSFDSKLSLARQTGMLSQEVADSVRVLHGYRNTSYHQGRRHEGILHSLAIFYFRNACSVMEGFNPNSWSMSGRDSISHRAVKYLGKPKLFDLKKQLPEVCSRLREVADSLGDSLIQDVHSDMQQTIDYVDEQIKFLAVEGPSTASRDQVIVDAQAWPFAFSEEGKRWAQMNGCPELPVGGCVDWLAANYPWPTPSDPVTSWRRRAVGVASETDPHTALKKYSDFMRQTEVVRGLIEESAAQLDAHIQHLIDVARGK